ncbi:Vesicle-associated membrane protein 5 [Bagarius yarrelli]|uniref:Vesicle-associated membrane protein 5 n=1 Tax=Bagarius yarrelli TaxID=175774 RepID=A0A556V0V8_BAGYA|nr:Vesicle-associated membrane protein 5 [Bagarius yarrelli]
MCSLISSLWNVLLLHYDQENGRNRLEQAQQDVEEVREIMLENLSKASEREGKLGDLENRADQLLEQSKVFSKTSNQVKQKKQWENIKLKVILGIIVVAILLTIIITVLVVFTNKGEDAGTNGSG